MQEPDSEVGRTGFIYKQTGRDWNGARGTGVERNRLGTGMQAGLETGR